MCTPTAIARSPCRSPLASSAAIGLSHGDKFFLCARSILAPSLPAPPCTYSISAPSTEELALPGLQLPCLLHASIGLFLGIESFAYADFEDGTGSQARPATLRSALHKCFPGLRGCLPRSGAIVAAFSKLDPAESATSRPAFLLGLFLNWLSFNAVI